MNIALSNHIRQQAANKGFALSDIQDILSNPETTYPSHQHTCRVHGTAQQKWLGTTANGQKLCVAVSPCCRVAVTVFQHEARTALRPDQIKNRKGK